MSNIKLTIHNLYPLTSAKIRRLAEMHASNGYDFELTSSQLGMKIWELHSIFLNNERVRSEVCKVMKEEDKKRK